MTDYDEDFIKSVSDFEKILDANWFDELDKMSDPKEIISSIKWKIHYLQYTVRMLYLVIGNEMTETNRTRALITKLPKTHEFDEIRAELEEVKRTDKEVTIKVPQILEKELKEWLAERERAKKAQGQYVT